MKRIFLCVAILCAIQLAFCDEEYEDHGNYDHHERPDHHHDHPDGSDTYSFDHEVFLGSKSLAAEFAGMEPDEAKDRLLVIAQSMDTNKDGSLSKEEFVATLMKNFLALDQEEALDRLHTIDDNKDSFVDWPEYVRHTYNSVPATLDELVANTSAHADPSVKSTVRTYTNDQARFKLADTDHDGKLSLVEFTSFSHPYDFEHMLPAETKITIDSYDVDDDGKISLAEFTRPDSTGGSAEWVKQETDRFNNELDKNKDGYLDFSEVQQWVSPTLQTSSLDEAKHLIGLVDTDGDGALSQEELVNGYHVLVGSAPEDDHDDDDDNEHDEL